MPEFKPFSMADALGAATGAAYRTTAMRSMQDALAGERAFRATAQQAAAGRPGPAAPSAPLPPGAPGPGPVTEPPRDVMGGNPMGVQGQGMPMAASGQSGSAQAITQLFTIETAGHKKGYDPEYHAQLLEQSGYPDRAMALRSIKSKQTAEKLGMQTQILDYLAKAAPLVTDQESLDALRGSLHSIGLETNILPQVFDESTQRQLQVVGLGAGKQADLLFKQMQLGETMRHNRATEANAAEKNRISKAAGRSTSAKKYEELKATGIPDQIAKAVAYGGVRMVSDPLGLGAVFIDELTGQKLGELKSGKWSTTPGAFSQPAGPAGGGRPPIDAFYK